MVDVDGRVVVPAAEVPLDPGDGAIDVIGFRQARRNIAKSVVDQGVLARGGERVVRVQLAIA